MMNNLLQCYNKGCAQKYRSEENNEDACCYHPGGPMFHDAYKGWSCCNKKVTDFTEFLNIKGCARGRHSNVKPTEPEKVTKTGPVYESEEISNQVQKPPPLLERPAVNTPLVRLPQTVASALSTALEKQLQRVTLEENGSSNVTVKPGTSCKNNACQKVYLSEVSNSETCTHHPGVPIFHEGMKYWSCCQRKTTEFDNFLQQEGCSSGNHCWVEKEGKLVSCRHDWYQTGSHVYISVYAKLANPEKCYVEVNPVKAKIHIEFERSKVFELDAVLHGIVDVAKSSVSLLSTKVEIKLKKAEPVSWRCLEQAQDSGLTAYTTLHT